MTSLRLRSPMLCSQSPQQRHSRSDPDFAGRKFPEANTTILSFSSQTVPWELLPIGVVVFRGASPMAKISISGMSGLSEFSAVVTTSPASDLNLLRQYLSPNRRPNTTVRQAPSLRGADMTLALCHEPFPSLRLWQRLLSWTYFYCRTRELRPPASYPP